MQNDGKIQSTFVFLFVLNCLVLISVVTPLSLTYAQEIQDLHQKTLYELAKPTSPSQSAHITVGKTPLFLRVDILRHKVYVANTFDNTISVIDTINNTKIGDDIKVGNRPDRIGVDTLRHKAYVANYGSNTISVIDTINNTKIGDDIRVGNKPAGIGVDTETHTVYVSNSDDNAVSVIDERANKVVIGVIFNVSPFNGGHIECDKSKLIAPTAQQFYLWPGSECSAIPNHGFEFVSWQENLSGNSSRLIKISSPPSILDSILDTLHLRTDNPGSAVITKFGSFTANFKAVSPPIPPEYIATLFTVVATAFVGSWLTPAIVGWRNAKNQGNRLDHYHNQVKSLYDDDGKLDKNDIEGLNKLKDSIGDEYTRGKITKEQYDKLADEISTSYREIYSKEIDSLDNIHEKDKVKQLSGIKINIDDMRAEGKLSDQHYIDLKKRISVFYEEMLKNEIDSLNSLPGDDRITGLNRIKNEISDAYSKEMIDELHYSLLKEKLSIT